MNIAVLFRAIGSFSWLIAVAVLVIILTRAARNRPVRRGGMIVLIFFAVALVLSTISAGLVFVNPQERAVVISAVSPTGYRENSLEPGLHWVIPFAENVITYPISKQTYTMSIAPSEGQLEGDDSVEARTSDGQKVLVDASIIFRIDPTKVVGVHISWQDRYSDDLVRPLTRGVIRDAVSQFRVEESYSTKRDELVKRIRETLAPKLEQNGLILEDFLLRNISFSSEYAASVEQKQIAEQQAQQARFVVEQKKQEADQAREVAKGMADAAVTKSKGEAEARIIQAEAEAKALELVAEALKNRPELLTYQYITKLAPNMQVMMLPSNSPFLFPLPSTIGPGTSSSAQPSTTTP